MIQDSSKSLGGLAYYDNRRYTDQFFKSSFVPAASFIRFKTLASLGYGGGREHPSHIQGWLALIC
jgi:hypothetical protein